MAAKSLVERIHRRRQFVSHSPGESQHVAGNTREVFSTGACTDTSISTRGDSAGLGPDECGCDGRQIICEHDMQMDDFSSLFPRGCGHTAPFSNRHAMRESVCRPQGHTYSRSRPIKPASSSKVDGPSVFERSEGKSMPQNRFATPDLSI
jgi:hypothetical protein